MRTCIMYLSYANPYAYPLLSRNHTSTHPVCTAMIILQRFGTCLGLEDVKGIGFSFSTQLLRFHINIMISRWPFFWHSQCLSLCCRYTADSYAHSCQQGQDAGNSPDAHRQHGSWQWAVWSCPCSCRKGQHHTQAQNQPKPLPGVFTNYAYHLFT